MRLKLDSAALRWFVAGAAFRVQPASYIQTANDRLPDIEHYAQQAQVTTLSATTHLYRWRFAGMLVFFLLHLTCIAAAITLAMADHTLPAVLIALTPVVSQQLALRFSRS